jgi:hypothetical protein
VTYPYSLGGGITFLDTPPCNEQSDAAKSGYKKSCEDKKIAYWKKPEGFLEETVWFNRRSKEVKRYQTHKTDSRNENTNTNQAASWIL